MQMEITNTKLIKPIKAVEVIADYFDKICDTEHTFDESELLRLMDSNAEVDAVPVVRCKNCKRYREYTYLGTQKIYVCKRDYRKRIYDMKEDDFCSRGEPRSATVVQEISESCNNDSVIALHDIFLHVGSITYGKERWFDQGDGTWYDRRHCD